MLLACAALIGSLCVPPQYVAMAQFTALQQAPAPFDPKTVLARGNAIWFWNSEAVATMRRADLSRYCAEGWCIYYQKHCLRPALVCTFVVSDEFAADKPMQTVPVHKGFSIHEGRSVLKWRMLERDVQYVIHRNPDGTGVSVPLGQIPGG
jgi:hypothetical protein